MEFPKRARKYFLLGICFCFIFLIFVMTPSWRKYLLIAFGVLALGLGLLYLTYKRPMACREPKQQEEVVLEEGKSYCYLCKTQVPTEAWESGEHRIGCGVKYFDKLSRMHEYPQKKCPNCLKYLRIWYGENEMFYCDNNRLCPRSGGSAICNWPGTRTRLNCFQCNTNFCITCGEGPPATPAIIDPTPLITSTPEVHTSLDPEPTTWVPSAPPDEMPIPSEEPTTWVPLAPPDELRIPSEEQFIAPPSYEEAIQ